MRLWESVKAKWRGETRIKGAERGRLFEKLGATPVGEPTKVNKDTTVELVGIKVIREDGTIEEIL